VPNDVIKQLNVVFSEDPIRKKMNCKQFNSIGLEEVLATLGHLPSRQNEKEAWYLSPFGPESKASFKIDRPSNRWYLFSEGIGGNNTDFMQKYLNTSVTEVLQWASGRNFYSFHQQNNVPKPTKTYEIDQILQLRHPNLKNYLWQRGLSSKTYPYVKEVWFTLGGKKLYAIGFENLSGGFELRNSIYQGSVFKKDISLFQINKTDSTENSIDRNTIKLPEGNGSGVVSVFEGFMDALSFIELQKPFKGDLLILNSVALLKRAMQQLGDYADINLFLDNDKAGIKCSNEIIKAYPHAKDFSHIYSDHKDLNQYLMEKRQRQTRSAPKTEDIPIQKNGSAEKQESCKEETNRIKKGVRRRM